LFNLFSNCTVTGADADADAQSGSEARNMIRAHAQQQQRQVGKLVLSDDGRLNWTSCKASSGMQGNQKKKKKKKRFLIIPCGRKKLGVVSKEFFFSPYHSRMTPGTHFGIIQRVGA